ncbi:MAG: hypothetical protein IPM58_02970 [Nitrospira sp.]|nr:hypothetical protein [Nitrospira sp.]
MQSWAISGKEYASMLVRSLIVSYVVFGVSVAFADGGGAQGAGQLPVGKDGAPMIVVPAGSFPMGVPSGDRDGGRDEYPRHEVFIDTFAIDKFGDERSVSGLREDDRAARAAESYESHAKFVAR